MSKALIRFSTCTLAAALAAVGAAAPTEEESLIRAEIAGDLAA